MQIKTPLIFFLIFYILCYYLINLMSSSDSLSSGNHQSQQQDRPQATSLRKQCLDSLRFPTKFSATQSKPKTHLLACMSEFIDEQPEVKAEQIEDFCCFDRMKRIVEKRRNDEPEKIKADTKQSHQNEKLMKFIQIEAKMKKMEQNLMKYSGSVKKNEEVNKKSNIYQQSSTNMFLTAPTQEKWKDGTFLETRENKENIQNLPGGFQMRKKIREQGYRQYMQWQKKKIVDSENDIRQFVETEIQEKVKSMLEERDIKFNELLKKNKNLQRLILEKNLEIQNLKSKQQSLFKNVADLQSFKNEFSVENTQKNIQKMSYLENFNQEFIQTFPNHSIRSLKQYIQTLVEKCLKKFNDIECKNFDRWNQEKLQMGQKIHKLQATIHKLKANENDLLSNLKQCRTAQGAATFEMDVLLKKQSELEKLQKKILSLYNEWYGKVPDSSKEIMKNIGYLQANYEYQKMLQHIVVFDKKFSADSKVNDYLIKILRGIQRIRKILFPKSVTNSEQRNQIMDPLCILEKLEKYMKCKVYQIQKKVNCVHRRARASFIIEQQFLGVENEDKVDADSSRLQVQGKEDKKMFGGSVHSKSLHGFKARLASPKNESVFIDSRSKILRK